MLQVRKLILLQVTKLYGRVCDTPPTNTSTVKHSMASWSFCVQKHVCGNKIDTPDALSHCQISKTLKKKNVASYERPLVLNGHFWLVVVVAAQKRIYCNASIKLIHRAYL